MTHFKAAVFDWAGTMVDFGSFAPMGVFVKAFEQFGITATIEHARGPMGAPKWDHIRTMMDMPEIASQWEAKYGNTPSDADVDKVYEIFVPMNEKVAADYADLVPGGKAAIDELRAMGLKIGSTTGYTRSIMENVLPVAAAQGYEPDNLVCSDDLPEGRPGPLGMYKCMVDLVAYPPAAIIKVDDTEPGIKEGVAAGCVTVGVAMSGNAVGKTPEELAALSEEEIAALRAHATKILKDAGADYVIDSVADLPDLVRELSKG
ncbi:phosphonoacetaldehyde hydrolase [Shimia sp. MMG029]|uniref:phosphonoacetaldehyde hydrolase n=1 Tax=Shimia sp. MMG029 TaxID=3021978 RepID=UPI0022FE83BC|nr:phosphonoacetaldehyde hydrolase [Shimia sp. MMG029]MDA5559015.1 phosphonoacetaldehyde hydrolase [Shimia sp. MMG029]